VERLRFNRNQASLPEIRRCFPNLAVFAEFLPVVPEFQHVPGFVPFLQNSCRLLPNWQLVANSRCFCRFRPVPQILPFLQNSCRLFPNSSMSPDSCRFPECRRLLPNWQLVANSRRSCRIRGFTLLKVAGFTRFTASHGFLLAGYGFTSFTDSRSLRMFVADSRIHVAEGCRIPADSCRIHAFDSAKLPSSAESACQVLPSLPN
jgi:hypothetical protein